MGKLKYTSNGVTILNELTITGSDGTSVNVKEKLDEAGSSIIYEGTFNADECLTPGIYQYITTGRAGLDTTNDNYYSLLVMKTNENTIRQIAFGSKLHSNVYSRVCVNEDWSDSGSVYAFQKIGNVNTINLNSSVDITAKQALANKYNIEEFFIADGNGNFPGEGTVTVTADNIKVLENTLLTQSDAISAFTANWQAYYQISDTWYSQTVSDYLKTTSEKKFNIGDKLRIYNKQTTIINYFKQIVDWKNIDVSGKMSTAELLLWNSYKLAQGGSSLSDGEFIVKLINDGKIYSAYSEPNEGGTTYQMLGSDALEVLSYTIISQADHSLQNNGSTVINAYQSTVIPESDNWVVEVGSETRDSATQLMEIYAGWSSLDQKEFHLYMPIENCNPNSVIKVRCFFRKGGGATDYQFDSTAYMYVSNTVNNIYGGYDKYDGTNKLMSDYVKVPSLGSFDLLGSSYPDNLTSVRNNFYTDDTDYGWVYLKTNNAVKGTVYLHIYGTFDTIKSWFCLDYLKVVKYTPVDVCSEIGTISSLNTEDKTSLVNAINELVTRIKTLEDK